MEAKAKSLRFLGESPQKITVPFFQRRYVWQKSNWKELFDNVNNNDSKPFLGSIIIKELGRTNPTEAVIVDGQQRLTTLTILAKTLYDCIDVTRHTGVRNSIENFLFYRVNSADNFNQSFVKISHSMSDYKEYNKIMRAGLLDEEYLNIDEMIIGSSNILKCYKFFKERVEDMPEESRIKLFNNLFSDDMKMIVLIKLDENDANEQSIFDTINRTGVRLNSADIIKNYLFQKCLDLCGSSRNEVINVYNEYWGDFFYKSDVENNLWDNERYFGNNQRTNLEFILYCVSIILWGLDDKSFSDLPSVYIQKTGNFRTFAEYIDLIKKIHKYASIFLNKILKLQKRMYSDFPPDFSHTNFETRFLLTLEKFGVQMFYPYVLFLLGSGESKEELRTKLGKLESFIIRSRVAKKGVSDYASKCSDLMHSENREVVIEGWFNSDQNLKDVGLFSKLDDIKNDTAKLILFNIELFLRRSNNEDVQSLKYIYTLEHIMPQKWENTWKDVPIIDEYGNQLTDNYGNPVSPISLHEAEAYRKRYVNNIGNMTLLTKNLNSTLRNANFEAKIKGNDNHKGYEYHSSLKITKILIDTYQNESKIWDESSIRLRKKLLFEIVKQIWPEI